MKPEKFQETYAERISSVNVCALAWTELIGICGLSQGLWIR